MRRPRSITMCDVVVVVVVWKAFESECVRWRATDFPLLIRLPFEPAFGVDRTLQPTWLPLGICCGQRARHCHICSTECFARASRGCRQRCSCNGWLAWLASTHNVISRVVSGRKFPVSSVRQVLLLGLSRAAGSDRGRLHPGQCSG